MVVGEMLWNGVFETVELPSVRYFDSRFPHKSASSTLLVLDLAAVLRRILMPTP